ncbi:hypothetical protein [Streptomyces ziwulingensis]|uniref:Uncharacterized protein n=1 Tax=Streptomyces ziwulingensis TaxID=1045501 RepID=A0ABP9D8S5_9ACTN
MSTPRRRLDTGPGTPDTTAATMETAPRLLSAEWARPGAGPGRGENTRTRPPAGRAAGHWARIRSQQHWSGALRGRGTDTIRT